MSLAYASGHYASVNDFDRLTGMGAYSEREFYAPNIFLDTIFDDGIYTTALSSLYCH